MNRSVQDGFAIAVIQQTGLRHLKQQKQCEDIVYTRSTPALCFCGLADGQSERGHCMIGARASLSAAADYLESRGLEALSCRRYTDEIQFELTKAIRNRIAELSQSYGVMPEEFSSTLIGLAFHPESGEYMITHLGDGCIIGVQHDHMVRMISAPDNGITDQYTWLTTSDQMLLHLRVCFGNVSCYQRVMLMTDGVKCLCRSKNISRAGKKMLDEADQEELRRYISQSEPEDDASCIILDFNRVLPDSIYRGIQN